MSESFSFLGHSGHQSTRPQNPSLSSCPPSTTLCAGNVNVRVPTGGREVYVCPLCFLSSLRDFPALLSPTAFIYHQWISWTSLMFSPWVLNSQKELQIRLRSLSSIFWDLTLGRVLKIFASNQFSQNFPLGSNVRLLTPGYILREMVYCFVVIPFWRIQSIFTFSKVNSWLWKAGRQTQGDKAFPQAPGSAASPDLGCGAQAMWPGLFLLLDSVSSGDETKLVFFKRHIYDKSYRHCSTEINIMSQLLWFLD